MYSLSASLYLPPWSNRIIKQKEPQKRIGTEIEGEGVGM